MKVLFQRVGVLAVFCTIAGSAATITYNATAPAILFANGLGTTVTFHSLLGATATPAPGFGTYASLGDIVVNSNAPASAPVAVSGSFTLHVQETAPENGPGGDLFGILSGDVSTTSSTAVVTFSSAPATTPPSFVIGNASKYLFTLYNRNPVALAPPSTNGGLTSLEAQITQLTPDVAVPEPATCVLLGGGLLAFAAARWRRL